MLSIKAFIDHNAFASGYQESAVKVFLVLA